MKNQILTFVLVLVGLTGVAQANYCDWSSAQDLVAAQVKKEMCKDATAVTCDNLRVGAIGIPGKDDIKVFYSYDFHSLLGTTPIAGYRVIRSDCGIEDSGAEFFLFRKY